MGSREKCAADLTAVLMRSLVPRLAPNCYRIVLKLTKVRFVCLEGILLLKTLCLKIDCNFLFVLAC